MNTLRARRFLSGFTNTTETPSEHHQQHKHEKHEFPMRRGITRLSVLLGLAALSSWTYLDLTAETKCHKFHNHNPLLVLGLLLLVLSFLQIITRYLIVGKSNNNNVIGYWYPMVMAVLIFIVFAYTVFVLSVTSAYDGEKYPDRAYKEYKMEDYSDLFGTYTPRLFDRYENHLCLRHSKICSTFALQTSHLNASQVSRLNLSPIQASCCREPSYCGFDDHQVKEERWRSVCDLPRDCERYDEKNNKYCHKCNSCIGALLSIVNKELRHFAFTNIWVTFLFSIHCFFTNKPTKSFTRLDTAFPA